MRTQLRILLFFLALPIFGQSHEVAGWAMSGGIGWTLAEGRREIDFDEVVGAGASYTRFFSPSLAAELALSRTGAAGIGISDLDLTTVTATAQWHLGADRFDPYLGAGIAFAVADVEGLSIDGESAWLLNAGVGFALTERVGIVLDGKYLRYRPDSTDGAGEGLRLDLDPLLVGAGLRFRF